jgi:beta-lactamase class A
MPHPDDVRRPRSPRGRRIRDAAAIASVGIVAAIALAGCLSFGQTPAAHIVGASTAASDATATDSQTASAASIGLDTKRVVAAALPAELTTYIKGRGGNAAVSVLDRTSGATVAINANRIFQTASIVKFDILATRLYQHQRSNTSMSSREKALAFKMITQSDNNAASALFAMDGRASGLTAANQTFGLKATHVASAWGLTHTTPADQIRLLTAVMDPTGPISQANRDYLLSLMSRVEPGQRWGVPAAATSAAIGVYNKNGWDTMTAYGGRWGDNSIGRIVEPGHDWLVAVMSNYNRTDNAGHALDGTIATLAVGGLRFQAQLAAAP